MSMVRRVLFALAGIVATFLYWGAAWIHLFSMSFCVAVNPPCDGMESIRLGRMFEAFTAYLAVYVLILCAGWIIIPLLLKRK